VLTFLSNVLTLQRNVQAKLRKGFTFQRNVSMKQRNGFIFQKSGLALLDECESLHIAQSDVEAVEARLREVI
jgi:hypothetical protein